MVWVKCVRSGRTIGVSGGICMKKRSFLLPLAFSLTALVAGSGIAVAKPVAPTMVTAPAENAASATPTATKPLVLKRAGDTKVAQWHSSHGSHASHASHHSHYSSR
jgi:hypothetical protein